MQQVFKNALFHQEPTVLKRRLLPLSCYHVLVLMAADNPYVVKQVPNPTLIDLAFGVAVCSRTREQCEIWLPADGMLDGIKAWGKTCRKMDFRAEGLSFENYLADYSAFPDRWSKTKTPTPCQHPWPLLVVVTIMPMVGESRAWNMPLPEAISLWSAYQETQGDSSLKTDWEYNALAALKAAAIRKEANK